MEGRVVEYDEHAGYGYVDTPDGGRHFFHCTQIAGGSRTIPVGAGVRFTLVPGLLGQWEAAQVEPSVR